MSDKSPFKVRKDADTEGDFFGTYHKLTATSLNQFQNLSWMSGRGLEPCAGAGDIMQGLINSKIPQLSKITKFDMFDKNPRIKAVNKLDFMSHAIKKEYDFAFSNPPYHILLEFFFQIIKAVKTDIVLLLKLDHLTGYERYMKLYQEGYEHGFRLKHVSILNRYPLFGRMFYPDGPLPTGGIAFAWYWFQYGYTGPFTMSHIDINDIIGFPKVDLKYAERNLSKLKPYELELYKKALKISLDPQLNLLDIK